MVVTLILVAVLFGNRLGLRNPPPAQIGGRGQQGFAPDIARPPDPRTGAHADAGPGGATPPPPEDVLRGLDADERNNIQVYAAVNKSVVNITTEATELGFFGEDTTSGSGSGFVIDKAGHILTNFHVVDGADTVRVTLFDGSHQDAKVVGADAANDVAVLQIGAPAEKLVPVSLGDSSRVLVGQKILALGNPFGLERTLTSGIVSAWSARSRHATAGRSRGSSRRMLRSTPATPAARC